MSLTKKQNKIIKKRSEKKLPIIVGLCLFFVGCIILVLSLWRIILPFFAILIIFHYLHKKRKN